MKKFFALLKVSVKSMLLSSTNSQGGSRKRAATGVGAMVLIAFLGLYMSGFYSWMLMDVLAPVHMEVLVFIFMGMGALVGGLLFTTFAVKGVVFGGRDNDLLLSMPVSSTMLMASRVSAIYLENLLFSLFVLGPAGAVCAFMTQSGVGHSALFWVRLVVAVFALPLLDTALSVLFGALLDKEAKRFFGTPMYFWNSGLGLIMLVAMGVAALVMQEDLRMYLGLLGDMMPVMPMAALVMLFCLSMSAIAAPSISLEGKYLWILREAPVGEGELLWIKTGFQLLLSVPCTVIGGVLLTIALQLSALEGAALLLATLLFNLGHAAFGMLMGLTFPKLDAVNETVVLKQGMAVMLGMFVPMAAVGGCALLYWAGGKLAPWAALALPLSLLAALTAVCVFVLVKKGPAMLKAL